MRKDALARLGLLVVALAGLGLMAGCSSSDNPMNSLAASSEGANQLSGGLGFGNEDNKASLNGDILRVDFDSEVILLDVTSSAGDGDGLVYFTKKTQVQLPDGKRTQILTATLSTGTSITAFGTRQVDGRFLADLIVLPPSDRSTEVGIAVDGGLGFGNEDNKASLSGDILKVDFDAEVILLDVTGSAGAGDGVVRFNKMTEVVLPNGKRAGLDANTLSAGVFVSASGTIQADGSFLAALIVLPQVERTVEAGVSQG
jgi:hypothetical protein